MVVIRYILFVLVFSIFVLPLFLARAAADYSRDRLDMVRHQIELEGVTHKATLKAMRIVPRHEFVPKRAVRYAYDNRPLPIGYGQTISQPFIVGYMTEQLDPRPSHRVLEIGTGSGYQAAVLARIVKQVYTVEIIPELAKQAAKRLAKKYPSVKVIRGDGYHGWKAGAPYDSIIVTAAADFIPPPLIEQLKEGGKMIIPLGSPYGMQWLVLITKKKGQLMSRRLVPVQFVPFTRSK
jgi:protein-L-isoaspartate(D-aspartate) O-methyltransferase